MRLRQCVVCGDELRETQKRYCSPKCKLSVPCSVCGQRPRSVHSTKCQECYNAYQRENMKKLRAASPVRSKRKARNGIDPTLCITCEKAPRLPYVSYCQACYLERNRKWREENRDHYNTYRRNHRDIENLRADMYVMDLIEENRERRGIRLNRSNAA